MNDPIYCYFISFSIKCYNSYVKKIKGPQADV